jgi:hypothetical protein
VQGIPTATKFVPQGLTAQTPILDVWERSSTFTSFCRSDDKQAKIRIPLASPTASLSSEEDGARATTWSGAARNPD